MIIFKSIEGHATPEQIFHEINQGDQKISLATVYRNLNILCEMNKINKIVHPIEGYQYDKTCCTALSFTLYKPNRIVDLDIPYLESFNEEIARQTGLTIKTHNMMAEGICEDCMKKQIVTKSEY